MEHDAAAWVRAAAALDGSRPPLFAVPADRGWRLMLRALPVPTLTCPQCDQPGSHGTADECIAALQSAISNQPPRPRPFPKSAPPAKAKPALIAKPPDLETSDPSKPLTMRQACALVQVTRSTLYNWKRAGKIDWEYTVGGAVRIQRASLFRAKRNEMPR